MLGLQAEHPVPHTLLLRGPGVQLRPCRDKAAGRSFPQPDPIRKEFDSGPFVQVFVH